MFCRVLFGRLTLCSVTLLFLLGSVGSTDAQDDLLLENEAEVESDSVKRLRELADPDAVAERREREQKPRFEFSKTDIAPFDTLPLIKPDHWSWLTVQLQANLETYEGRLQTAPIPLRGMPMQMVYRRQVGLIEGQLMRMSWPVFIPIPPSSKSFGIDLGRINAIRPDNGTDAVVRPLEAHQMVLLILANDVDSYTLWRDYQAILGATTDRSDPTAKERRAYYRVVQPIEPENPNLSPHPLTWTTTSHVIWDSVEPKVLSLGQQRAMIDWIHWGGQLVIAGGATPTPAFISDRDESLIAPYLPGVPNGLSSLVPPDEFQEFQDSYEAPRWRDALDSFDVQNYSPRSLKESTPAPEEARPPESEAGLYLAGLDPIGSDVVSLRLHGNRGPVIGLERRVGRGRILMLAFDPKEAELLKWPGNDQMTRQIILRRPNDPWRVGDRNDSRMLAGTDLSWYRLLSRDLIQLPPPQTRKGEKDSTEEAELPKEPTVPTASAEGKVVPSNPVPGPGYVDPSIDPDQDRLPDDPVAAWRDDSGMPNLARSALVAALGIEIPAPTFVLRIVLLYVVSLVPLNWLVCRFLLRRRELAWGIVPLLALGFAIAVERAAAIDLGYDRACDEVTLVELQPGYPRAHVSRFSVLYSNSRDAFEIIYPSDPTALVLPLDTRSSIRGDAITQAVFQTTPDPGLVDFQVEPRSLAMYRSEQLILLPNAPGFPEDLGRFQGVIGLDTTEDGRNQLINGTAIDLRDAVLIEVGTGLNGLNRYQPIGQIPPGAVIELDSLQAVEEFEPELATEDQPDWLDLESFVSPLRAYNWNGPADAGELRLVGWSTDPIPGQVLTPEVDRHRVLTLVVSHLRYGPPPSPSAPLYNSKTYQASRVPEETMIDRLQGFLGESSENPAAFLNGLSQRGNPRTDSVPSGSSRSDRQP